MRVQVFFKVVTLGLALSALVNVSYAYLRQTPEGNYVAARPAYAPAPVYVNEGTTTTTTTVNPPPPAAPTATTATTTGNDAALLKLLNDSSGASNDKAKERRGMLIKLFLMQHGSQAVYTDATLAALRSNGYSDIAALFQAAPPVAVGAENSATPNATAQLWSFAPAAIKQ
jgi:hypothetical protein